MSATTIEACEALVKVVAKHASHRGDLICSGIVYCLAGMVAKGDDDLDELSLVFSQLAKKKHAEVRAQLNRLSRNRPI